MTIGNSRSDLATLGLFAAASLAAVAAGAAGLALTGAPASTWVKNPAAWFVGALLAPLFLLAGWRARVAVILLAVAGLGASFLSQPQAGVHRWIDAGPLHMNVAAFVLPATLVALAAVQNAAVRFVSVTAIGLLLVMQPDASQASAFLLAAASLWYAAKGPGRMAVAGLVLALVVAAWIQPDPLPPVAEVEGIFPLLAGASPPLAVLAAMALGAASLEPLVRLRSAAADRPATIALAIYLTVTAIMPALGAFPVPLVGLGMSFPIGYWIGIALLCADQRRPR